jgi:hypothetical protein
MPQKIIFEDCCIETALNIFYTTVCSDGGDGTGVFVCGNPEIAARFFEEQARKCSWCVLDLPYRKTIVGGDICYHDNNESFTFSNKMPENLFDNDYVFICANKLVPYIYFIKSGCTDYDMVILATYPTYKIL